MPIEFIERVRGDSKMSGQVASESLKLITRWGLPSGARSCAAPGSAVSHPAAPAPHADAAPARVGAPGARVAFVVVPLAGDLGLIQVGQLVGPWWTIALLVLDSMVGAWLIKREGGRAWKALREALQGGRMPAREIADGALILIGGTLMLSPGFVLDARRASC